MNHLTDAELAELLDGAPRPDISAHMRECGICAAEFTSLRGAIDAYSARGRSVTAPADLGFNSQMAARRGDWRLAFAPMAAMVAIAAILVALAPTPEPRPVTVSPDADEALLLEIQNDLYSDVPQALIPAAALSFERNRMANTAVR